MSDRIRARDRSIPLRRDTRHAVAALATALCLVVVLAPAGYAEGDTQVDDESKLVDLTFPVADPDNDIWFTDDFDHARSGGRLHAATDIMAPKHRPVHAAVGGTITHAPYPEPGYGWMLSIRGDDGKRYAYVHLNNDTPERDGSGAWLDDDDGGVEHAYAPKIVEAIEAKGSTLYKNDGVRVERGELIGWVGDSGNAKGIASHLHFEIHVESSDGEYRINPYESLKDALKRGDVPGAKQEPVVYDGRFKDVDPEVTHSDAIERLADDGIVSGCSDTHYCPGDAVTRADLAVSVAAVLGLATTATDTLRFDDVKDADPRAGAIAAVDAEGILTGYEDGSFGPEDALTRAQLASMLVRAFDIPEALEDPGFTDVTPGRVHADAIAATFEAGLTIGCDDGTRYCGRDEVTRAQIATFLDRAHTEFSG